MPLRASVLVAVVLTACASSQVAPGSSSGVEPDRDLDAACAKGLPTFCRQMAGVALDPANPHRSPGGALDLLAAACRTGDAIACDFARANFQAPAARTPVPGVVLRAEDPSDLARQGIVGCYVGIDGRLTRCKVIRSGGRSRDAEILGATSQASYSPGTFRGEAFEGFVFLRYVPVSSGADAGS